ncbi:hypothetical protein HELRODRAFT_143252, partial [Helobdella robusta]|uniref:Hemicentin-1-like von Willebrand factor A domain-containing protein n=1 Tax=Helobdella robusta TaxID=6412 RepID=T1EJ97_HELRO
SSLAFVFDTTGSMGNDLKQVREGAQKIFDAVQRRKDKAINNYVFVPFNDPGVGPAIVTTDTTYFQQVLQNVQVHGGGDCPELCLTGIKTALDRAYPNSFLYVFTDASAKDVHLLSEVLNLIQTKQCQVVVFVLTGDCNNPQDPRFMAYFEIASTSGGQVFNLQKGQVNKV